MIRVDSATGQQPIETASSFAPATMSRSAGSMGRRPAAGICAILILVLTPATWGKPPVAGADVLVRQAQKLARDAKHRQAAPLFERALQLASASLNARRGLGLSRLALGQYTQAAEHLRVVVAADPTDAVARGALGKALLGAGKPHQALEALRVASPLRPTDADLAFQLGKAAARLGRREEAKQAYHRALRLKPDSVASALGLAEQYAATGDHILVVETLSSFAGAEKPSADVLGRLVQAYEALGLQQEAMQTAARLADELPAGEAVPLWLKLGDYHAEKLNWSTARAQYARAAQADPGCAQAWLGLARCYLAPDADTAQWLSDGGGGLPVLSAPEDSRDGWSAPPAGPQAVALFALEQALLAAPNHQEALRLAADSARSLGLLGQAEKYLRRLLAHEPRSFQARSVVVDCLVAQGKLRQALLEAGEALRAPRPPAEAYMRAADLAEELGNPDLAITLWKRLMKQGDAHRRTATLAVGRLLMATRRAADAAKLYCEALERRPDWLEAQMALARAYQESGRDEQAIALLEPLVRARPSMVQAHVALAESLAWADRHDEAGRHIRQAMAAGPLDAGACHILVLTYGRRGDLDGAVEALLDLLPRGAPQDVVLELLAKLYRQTQQVDEGASRLVKVFEANSEHSRIGLAAADLLSEAGRFAQAEEVLMGLARRPDLRRQALGKLVEIHATVGVPERAPGPVCRLLEDLPSASWVIAELAELQYRPDLAARAGDILIAMAQAQPGGPDFWLAVARLAQFHERIPTTLARMQGLLAQTPDDPGIATGVAALALMDGRAQVAQDALQALPGHVRDHRAVLHTLARVRVALGQPERAVPCVQRIIASGRSLPSDHVLCARALQRMHEFEQALWHLAHALRVDPSNTAARQALREVIAGAQAGASSILEALAYVYYYNPHAPVIRALVAELAKRPDAQQVCHEWLKLHPEIRQQAYSAGRVGTIEAGEDGA